MHLTQFVHRLLLDVAPGLGAVQRLLLRVLCRLRTIHPRLPVVQHPSDRRVVAVIVLTIGVQPCLVLIDLGLRPIAEQLLTVSEGLLEVGQALLLPQHDLGTSCVVILAHALPPP